MPNRALQSREISQAWVTLLRFLYRARFGPVTRAGGEPT